MSYLDAVENIDVGGPAMVRGAAKNHADVTVVVDPGDYVSLLDEISAGAGATRQEFRATLAAKAFAHTAGYDALVADWLGRQQAPASEPFPAQLNLALTRIATLRYGENPHQHAAFYRAAQAAPFQPIVGQGAHVLANQVAADRRQSGAHPGPIERRGLPLGR